MSLTVAAIRVKRVIQEKWGLIGWLAIPTLIVFLMSLIAGTGGGGKLTGRLLITDHDESVVSQFVAGGFTQGPLAEVFTLQQVSETEGQGMMDAGEASAWIVIPMGFGEALLANETTELKLLKNPAQSILPKMVETAMQLLVDAATYVQILFAQELALIKPMLENQQFNDADLVALTLGIRQQIQQLEQTLFPPQIKLAEQVSAPAESDQPTISFGLLMFPGAIFMALIFCANSLAVAFWDDARNGVIPRLSATPSALGAYLNGQFIAAALLFGLLVLVLGLLGTWYFDLPWQQLPLMLLWLVFSGLVLWWLFTAISLLMPSAKAANITISATAFPLLMLGGSFFPMESMPDWLAKIGAFLPNGFLLKGLKDWLIRQEPAWDALLWPLLLGLVVVALCWLLSRYLMTKLIHKV